MRRALLALLLLTTLTLTLTAAPVPFPKPRPSMAGRWEVTWNHACHGIYCTGAGSSEYLFTDGEAFTLVLRRDGTGEAVRPHATFALLWAQDGDILSVREIGTFPHCGRVHQSDFKWAVRLERGRWFGELVGFEGNGPATFKQLKPEGK